MLHWLQTAFSTYVLHVEKGNGYQWWSGMGANFGEATVVAAILGTAKHHNCHHKGCWFPGHRHPTYGWPACKKHWNEKPDHVDDHSVRQ